MLKTFKRIFSKNNSATPSDPHIIPSGSHPIKPQMISAGARQIVEILQQHEFQAYLVGGCVRDLLLDLRPKDFDIATDATPEEVNAIFKRARIIGRRFKIVHVRMRSEVIEVTTFRASHQMQNNHSKQDSKQSAQGMLLRDNIFGTINDDAARRDFTINALYYQPSDNTVYDYANGQRDLDKRLLRIIGDPATRYREDPVRILRAIRFSAKLGFSIEPATAKPIEKQAPLLRDISTARLFDESLKLFMSGHALATFQALRDYHVFAILYPEVDRIISQDPGALKLLEQALINTDLRIRSNKRVTPAFIYAAFLWPVVIEHKRKLQADGDSPHYAQQRAAGKAIAQQCKQIAIPKRFTMPMREIWELQLRLPQRNGSRAFRLMENQRFRAGYDFLLLREQAGEIAPGVGDWWTAFQEADENKRNKMVSELSKHKTGKRKPRNRRRPAAEQ